MSDIYSQVRKGGKVSFNFDNVFGKLFHYSSVWSNAADTNLLKLQAVQNFAVRIICGSRKLDHETPLLKELYWLPCTCKTQLYLRDAVADSGIFDIPNSWRSKWSHDQKLPTSAYTLTQIQIWTKDILLSCSKSVEQFR